MKVPGSCVTSDNRNGTASISASNQSKNYDIFQLGMYCQMKKMPDGVISGGKCKFGAEMVKCNRLTDIYMH